MSKRLYWVRNDGYIGWYSADQSAPPDAIWSQIVDYDNIRERENADRVMKNISQQQINLMQRNSSGSSTGTYRRTKKRRSLLFYIVIGIIILVVLRYLGII